MALSDILHLLTKFQAHIWVLLSEVYSGGTAAFLVPCVDNSMSEAWYAYPIPLVVCIRTSKTLRAKAFGVSDIFIALYTLLWLRYHCKLSLLIRFVVR